MPNLKMRMLQAVQRARRKITGVRLLGAVVLALTVATGIQSYVQSKATEEQARRTEQESRRTEQLAGCIKAYSTALADAIDARSKSSGEAQEASDAFWFAIAQAPQTPEGRDQIRRVFDDYVAKRRQAKQTQAEHPYPPPPRDVCG
jgi:cytoskeletal protein RodZ